VAELVFNAVVMDATKKPLRIPPEFATYAEEHEIFDMYKVILRCFCHVM